MRIAHWPTVISMLICAAVLGMPSTAQASSREVLCEGYSSCRSKGYTDSGYGRVRDRAFWGMMTGHSCTNYVAYRLTKHRLVARPPGTGAARTWGTAAKDAGLRVARRAPRVGDVAWWTAGAGYAGDKGHVAVVERVRRDGSIVVSEDNMNRTFMWRVVRRGPQWPSGFVRYPTSDGSPSGVLESFSAQDGKITVRGVASEPDRAGQPIDYTVSLGAPLGRGPVETYSFSTAFHRFSWLKTVRTRGTVRAYLYAHNGKRTGGVDTLLGVATLQVRGTGSTVGTLVPRLEWLDEVLPIPLP